MHQSAVKTVQFRDDFETITLIGAIEQSLRVVAPNSGLEHPLKTILANLQIHGTGPAFSEFLSQTFSLDQVPDSQITGYYQPTIAGALERTSLFRYPIYALPDGELPDRSVIDCQHALAGRGLEIAWVNDLIDLYFLHIQGSGRLQLADGSTREVLFSGHNNRPYVAIGAEIARRASIPRGAISMSVIKHYLREHPNEVQELLNQNPRYVFFKLAESGPFGTSGAQLTPLRSIATDWHHCPPGALCHLHAPLPQFDAQGHYTHSTAQSLFVINQDTGGAITGIGRTDLFTGAGERAALLAGQLNTHGTLSIFRAKGS